MAPRFLIRIVREPIPGKAFELMDAVIESRKQMGVTDGMTTISVAAPRMLIVSSTPYENMAEIQSRVDGIFDSEELRAGWDRVGSLARSTVNNLSVVVEPPEGIESANYVQRYLFSHGPTSRRQLIAALREFRAHAEGTKFGITASLNTNVVVASSALQSLTDLEGPLERLQNDPGTITRAANVTAHCESWQSGIAKVVSRP